MNKNGKGNGMAWGFAIIAVLIVAILLVYPMVNQNLSTSTEGITDVGLCPDSTGILTINSFSTLSKSSNVTPTLTVGVNGAPVTSSATSGTTTYPIGADLKIHASLSDYIDTELSGKMSCGGLVLDNPMFYSTSDNPSIRIKNDDGDFMSDSFQGTTNQSALSAGETLTVDVEFQGTNLESSGKGIYIIELPASTSANVTDILMPGATKVSVPSVHTLVNAGSKAVAFEVPAIEGAEKKTYSVSIVLGSGKVISGGVYTDWYAQQKFVDTDGTISEGVEDGDGTAKYENTIDSDFFIDA